MKKTLYSLCRRRYSTSIILGLSIFTSVAYGQAQSDSISTEDTSGRMVLKTTANILQLEKDKLNKGHITSADQLLTGQIPGLRVMQPGSQPGTPANLRLHAQQTIFGKKSPLILVDGVILPQSSASEYAGILNAINPEEIATVTFLKDAASTAVYGSAAANGVLYITTKQAKKGNTTSLQFSSTASVSEVSKKVDVLTAGEFRSVVQELHPEKVDLLGNENTDWQNVIYQKAFSHDQNLSLSGVLLDKLPYRVSAGYLDQQGILRTTENQRSSLALSLNPSFLQDHLQVGVQLRTVQQKLRVADADRIVFSALIFDPTQPVYQQNDFGGYFQYTDENGNPNPYALNPLSQLEQREHHDKTGTLTGQAQVQYRLHFFPSLQINARYSTHRSTNDFHTSESAGMAAIYSSGQIFNEANRRQDQKELYLAYDHPTSFLQSNISLMAGLSSLINKFDKTENGTYPNGVKRNELWQNSEQKENSIFGKFFVVHRNKYSLEAAFAAGSNSHYRTIDNVLSYSLGMSWDVKQEKFMTSAEFLSSLNVHATYSSFQNTFEAPVTTTFVGNPDLVLENLRRAQVGSSFGIANDKLTGSVSLYRAESKDMFMLLRIAPHNNYDALLRNGGSMISYGIESYLNYKVIRSQYLKWNVGLNLSYNQDKVTSIPTEGYIRYAFDDRPGYTTGKFLVAKKGEPLNTIALIEHNYDNNGKPIENSYKLNTSGLPETFFKNSVDPSLTFGFHSTVTFKNFDLGLMLRGSKGNYTYNSFNAARGNAMRINSEMYLTNAAASYLKDGFKQMQIGRYYLEDASFIRLEYLQLGYRLNNLIKGKASLSLTGTIQNAFTLTRYSGQNPEAYGGDDFGTSPTARTYSLGLRLTI